ncbi:Xaa-Pro aminopeptidase [Rhodobacter sp. JA431]|uniref:M24 family metallopeptidase n=1 Tax=Rhodobacter sp. JA431 TaxID=570013 RepID=UPI000BD4B678|nr:M24 family metallopeptidase [Rhodobacter sp. JA431]SOC10378.1 Xaa-Pro aminopeptidase [Rhodobacter sp. JA431]
MSIVLKSLSVPSFGTPALCPEIPTEVYAARCDQLFAAAGTDWVAVYADREHLANIAFLTAFEPRFEEAFLLLGPAGRRVLICGNESRDYAPLSRLPGVEVVLCQSCSLMGQDRSVAPALSVVLAEIGVKTGDSIGVVGWKYLSGAEWGGAAPSFHASAYFVDSLRAAVGPQGTLTEATPILMHPETGLRAVVDVHQIAAWEWGAARASDAVWRIVQGVREGDDEFTAAARMGYMGEELSAHVMFASAPLGTPVVGLRSPRGRKLQKGDGVTTAVSYWGGLSSRAALFDTENDAFLEKAKGYFAGLIRWYETAKIGVTGGEIDAAVRETLAQSDLKPALNPGHLVGHDEWLHTPITPGSTEKLRSGMPFQVDVIPVPMPVGQALNNEDAVTFADVEMRADLARLYPEVAARIAARRAFMADEIGVALDDCILPMSNTPLCLAPFWLASDKLLVRAS